MKLREKSATVIFLLFLALSASYAQEKELKDVNEKNLNQNNTVKLQDTVTDKTQDTEKKTEAGNEKKESLNFKKKKISSLNNKPEKRQKIEKEISDNTITEVNEGDVLLINEGSFKYKRIPDIKITEKKVESVDSALGPGVVDSTKNPSGSSKANGFFGLGKTASDIIVKGGVLLLILLIFILYKARMSVPGGKSSKSRKVLNSFRK